MTLYETKSLLISAITAKNEDLEKDDATNLSTSGTISCPTSLPGSSSLPVMGLWGTTGAHPNPPSYLAQRDHSPVWQCTSLCPLPTPKLHSPCSCKAASASKYSNSPKSGMSNKPWQVPVCEPTPFWGALWETPSIFSLAPLALFIYWADFLEKNHAGISFFQKWEIIL